MSRAIYNAIYSGAELILQPFCHFTYVTSYSLNSPGKPPIIYRKVIATVSTGILAYRKVISTRILVYRKVICTRILVYRKVITTRILVYRKVITTRILVYRKVLSTVILVTCIIQIKKIKFCSVPCKSLKQKEHCIYQVTTIYQ